MRIKTNAAFYKAHGCFVPQNHPYHSWALKFSFISFILFSALRLHLYCYQISLREWIPFCYILAIASVRYCFMLLLLNNKIRTLQTCFYYHKILCLFYAQSPYCWKRLTILCNCFLFFCRNINGEVEESSRPLCPWQLVCKPTLWGKLTYIFNLNHIR